ncbi:YitT family protein [Mesoaciditoga sp.]
MKVRGKIVMNFVKEYSIISIGDFITAISIVSFLVPYNIAGGGASGLAIVLHCLINLPVGVWMYIINGALIALSLLFVGVDFSFKTIYSTFLLSFFVDFLNRMVHFPIYNGGDLMLATIFGDVIGAFGMALAFSQNGSTGGTDIIAKFMNKFFAVPLGQGVLIADVSIGILAGFKFGLNIGLYSLLAIILNGLAIDFLMRGMEMSKQVYIISEKNDQIADYIMQKLERGVTYIPAVGGYTKTDKKMILTVVRRRELSSLLHTIRKVDPQAFIVVGEVEKAYGEGFSDIKKF